MANLLALPPEILLDIIERLSSLDMKSLHYTNLLFHRLVYDGLASEMVVKFDQFISFEDENSSPQPRVVQYLHEPKLQLLSNRIHTLRLVGATSIQSSVYCEIFLHTFRRFLVTFQQLLEIDFNTELLSLDPKYFTQLLEFLNDYCGERKIKLNTVLLIDKYDFGIIKPLQHLHSLTILYRDLDVNAAEDLSNHIYTVLFRASSLVSLKITRANIYDPEYIEEVGFSPYAEDILRAPLSTLQSLCIDGEMMMDEDGMVVLDGDEFLRMKSLRKIKIKNAPDNRVWEMVQEANLSLEELIATGDRGQCASLLCVAQPNLTNTLTRLEVETSLTHYWQAEKVSDLATTFWEQVMPNIANSIAHLSYTFRDTPDCPFEPSILNTINTLSFLKNTTQDHLHLPALKTLQTAILIFEGNSDKWINTNMDEQNGDDEDDKPCTLTLSEVNNIFRNKPRLQDFTIKMRTVRRNQWQLSYCEGECYDSGIFEAIEGMQPCGGIVPLEGQLQILHTCYGWHANALRPSSKYWFGPSGRWILKEKIQRRAA